MLELLYNIADRPGRQLFVWHDEDGLVQPVDSSALNSVERPTIKGMCVAHQKMLSNTPAICRKSYVHPDLPDIATEEKTVKRLDKILSSDMKPIAG